MVVRHNLFVMKKEKQESSSLDNKETEVEHIIQPVDDETQLESTTMKRTIIIVYVVLAVLGLGTGYMLAGKKVPGQTVKTGTAENSTKSIGVSDTATFKDSAEGTIEKGGQNGEGTHKLIRAGGDSQTVYLISSVVDLDQYIGKKVKVWGQTQAAQHVAWLMDVGKIEF
jgi:hypothetical protein